MTVWRRTFSQEDYDHYDQDKHKMQIRPVSYHFLDVLFKKLWVIRLLSYLVRAIENILNLCDSEYLEKQKIGDAKKIWKIFQWKAVIPVNRLFMEAGLNIYIQSWSEEPSLYKLFGY